MVKKITAKEKEKQLPPKELPAEETVVASEDFEKLVETPTKEAAMVEEEDTRGALEKSGFLFEKKLNGGEGTFFTHEQKKPTRKAKHHHYGWLIVLAVIIILGVTFYLSIIFRKMDLTILGIKINNPYFEQLMGYEDPTVKVKTEEEVVLPSVEPSVIASNSADLTEEESASIRVQVLNGTGISGQAGKIKDEVEDLGLTVASVNNADEQSEDQAAQITLSQKVPVTVKNKLKSTLEKIFTKVTVTENTKSPTYDIVIVTGQEL